MNSRQSALTQHFEHAHDEMMVTADRLGTLVEARLKAGFDAARQHDHGTTRLADDPPRDAAEQHGPGRAVSP